MDFFIHNFNIVFFLILLSLGYGVGTISEKRHYISIRKREKLLLNMPVVTGEKGYSEKQVQKSILVTGSAVISNDYFKRLLAILRNIFGGRVKSYESLVDRARREAILRMKQDASNSGADIVINMRLETSAIGNSANRKRQVGSIEAIAYGTALVFVSGHEIHPETTK